MVAAESVHGLQGLPDGPVKALEPDGSLVAIIDHHHSRRQLKFFCVFN